MFPQYFLIMYFYNQICFKICSSAIIYLGIFIPTNLTQLYAWNYTPLLQRTLTDLTSYNHTVDSLFGRTNILKMDIVLRFLCFPIIDVGDQVLTNCIYQLYLGPSETSAPQNNFISPKSKGGAGVPDLSLYHVAAVLTRVVSWFHTGSAKQWVYIEQSLPWIEPVLRGFFLPFPFLQFTFIFWIDTWVGSLYHLL